MQAQIPLTQDILLIGGGHAHALVLRKWGMDPLPGTRLTVINPSPSAPYTGMLPGHIAGHYPREALDIDLVQLCNFAGARLICDRVVDLDPKTKVAILQSGRRIAYDIASLDIGITTDLPVVPGFHNFGIAAKPLDRYSDTWAAFLNQEAAGPVAVIGAGVAGVELSLAMAHALRARFGRAEVNLIERHSGLTGVSPATGRRLMAHLTQNEVGLHFGSAVAEITKTNVILEDGTSVSADLCVTASGAVPHPWLAQTGLPLKDGFIPVGADLRIEGYSDHFAVGDCAEFTPRPLVKAGVYAVRAAPVLFENLRATASGASLKAFRPQKHFLKLISLGKKSALAERAGHVVSGAAMWRWKDQIDRKFMTQFLDLPQMAQTPLPPAVARGVSEAVAGAKPLCGACGSKVGPGALGSVLGTLPPMTRPDILSGPGDDAASLRIGGQVQVITTDHLRSFTEDPARAARITAVHALGDIWAMGGRPQAALPQITLPRQSPTLQARSLQEIMEAANDVFTAAGAAIVGGHTSMGAELVIGFTVTGLVDRAIGLDGARPGDRLILTRPLGSGTVLAASMARMARGADVERMLEQMSAPQDRSSDILARVAHAMTDVTGFGLAGHLQAMCRASQVGADIALADLPLYDGVSDLIAQGVRSTLYPDNAAYAPVIGPEAPILHDPQTGGGLLAAVPVAAASQVIRQLAEAQVTAHQIGVITDQTGILTAK